jgi:hypothetical protein
MKRGASSMLITSVIKRCPIFEQIGQPMGAFSWSHKRSFVGREITELAVVW